MISLLLALTASPVPIDLDLAVFDCPTVEQVTADVLAGHSFDPTGIPKDCFCTQPEDAIPDCLGTEIPAGCINKLREDLDELKAAYLDDCDSIYAEEVGDIAAKLEDAVGPLVDACVAGGAPVTDKAVQGAVQGVYDAIFDKFCRRQAELKAAYDEDVELLLGIAARCCEVGR